MSEELGTAPQDHYEQHKRDSKELEWATKMSAKAMQKLGEAAVFADKTNASPERESMDIDNAEHAQEKAQNFATFEAQRAETAKTSYGASLAVSAEHFAAHEGAYQEQAALEARAAGVELNLPEPASQEAAPKGHA